MPLLPYMDDDENSTTALPYMDTPGTGIRQAAKRTALGTLKDTGVALAKGVVGAGEAAVGLADIVTPGNLGGGLRKAIGYDPAAAQQFLSSQYSPAQQEAIQRVEDAEGFTGTVKAAVQNPSVIASTVGESLPSMIGGQFLARAGLRALPRAAAALGKYAPVVAGALGEGAVTAGSTQENIRQQTGDTTLAQKGAALAAGAGTALLGAVGGRIAQKFGFADPDTFLLSIGSKQTTLGVIKRIIGGGISESVFEEMPQSAQEQVWLNAATNKPLTEGLGESVALGGLAGAAMGAGFNVMQPKTQEKLDTVQQRTLSNLIKGAQVSVAGGEATVVEEGKLPVTMKVKDLAEHLAAGGTMDTLTPEQRYGERGVLAPATTPATAGRPDTAVENVEADVFSREALAQNKQRNLPVAGMVRDATGRLVPVQDDYGIQTPSTPPDFNAGIRRRAPRTAMATTLSPESAQTLMEQGQAQDYMYLRNQQGLRSAARPTGMQGVQAAPTTVEEALYEAGINELPTLEQGIRRTAMGATTVPAFQRDADAIAAPMTAAADAYNKERNRPRGLVTPAKSEQQPAVSRVPGVSAEEVLAAEQAYQTGQEPVQVPKPITRSDGQPFSTERTAGVAMKRLGLRAEDVEVQPVAGGFVIIPKEKQNGSVRNEEASGGGGSPAGAVTRPGEAGAVGQVSQAGIGETGVVRPEQNAGVGSRTQEAAATGPGTGELTRDDQATSPAGVGAVSDSVDKSSETQYSVSDWGRLTREYKFTDVGEDTSAEGKAAANKIGKVLVRANPSKKISGTITTRQTPGTLVSTISSIEKVFGRRIVFFTSSDPSDYLPNGFIDKNDPKTIYVNAGSGFAPTTIIGHELLHAMRKERKALYDALKAAAVDKNLKLNAFTAYRERLKQTGYHEESKLTSDYVIEEMLADFIGDEFSRPEFWEQLAAAKPSLFKRLVAFVKSFLDDALKSAKSVKGFQSDQFFLGLQTMRDAAVTALAQYGGGKAMGAVKPSDIRFAAAWHGSPHRFDKFSTEKIGTGEGAAAFGHGLYFSSAKEVAEYYKNALSSTQRTLSIGKNKYPVDELYNLSTPEGKVVKSLFDMLDSGYAGEYAVEAARNRFKGSPAEMAILEGASTAEVSTERGALYQVELAPAEEDYLLWDKPLREQSEKVRKALEALPSVEDTWATGQLAKYQAKLAENEGRLTGENIENRISSILGSRKAASEYLHSLGVRGIKYLDGTSRAKGEGAFNYVLFSDEDVTITDVSFSTADGALKTGQQKAASMVQSLADPKSRLHELAVQYAPQWLSVTPLITLVQTFGKDIQQVKDFARHIDGVVATKTDIVDTSKVLYDKAMKLAQDGPGEKVFNYAAGIASFNRMKPWAGLFDQDWVPKTGTKEERLKMANVAWKRAGMDVATGKKFHEAHREAVAAYEALGSDEVKEAYVAIVEDLKRVRAREKNNLLSYIEAATVGNKDMRDQLMARFNATFSELQGAYWPLARVGDFRLSFTDKDGAKVVKHYVTMAERRRDKEQLIEDGIPAEAFVEDYKDKRTRNETAVPQELMTQLAGAVEAEYLKGVNLEDADAVSSAREAAQDVVSDMNQIWLRWQPETSALKNSLRRKNTRGFSEDMMRSYLDYMSRHASNIAWTEQGRKIEQDLKSLADDIREAQTKPGADTTMQRHILNDLRARVQAIRTARVGPVASGLGKLGTAYYMTSPSIALVQMSQLGVITLPKLATQFGWHRASKALAAGTKAAFTKAFTRKAIFEDPTVGNVFDNLRAVVTSENRDQPQAVGKALGDRLYTKQEMLAQIEGLTPYQQQLLALREATARNLLDISAAHEAYELTQGKDPNGPVSKVFRYAMLPMQLSELASRKAAVLSTFDLASQDGKNFFGAMNDVSSVVNDTLYSYAKEHKGAALQGGAPRVLLQFQHYRIMTGIRLMQLFLNSVKGETPEVKTAARKELAGIMGMAGALGGSMGLPAAGLVFAIMNALLGTDDEPYDSELEWRNWLKENLGETMGNVATTGLPYLLGADISRRVGMGDIFGMQQQPPPGLHGRNLFAWWAVSALGPVASVGQSWFQGYDEFSKGNYLKSLEVSTPKPIRDALKAYRVGTEGLKTSAGKKLLADEAIGADEVMLLALGFNADEVAQAQAAERSLNKMSTMVSERRGKLIRAAARGILEGDTSDVLGDVLEFNRRMPRFAVNGGDIRSAVRRMITGELGVTGPRDQAIADQFEIPSYL